MATGLYSLIFALIDQQLMHLYYQRQIGHIYAETEIFLHDLEVRPLELVFSLDFEVIIDVSLQNLSSRNKSLNGWMPPAFTNTLVSTHSNSKMPAFWPALTSSWSRLGLSFHPLQRPCSNSAVCIHSSIFADTTSCTVVGRRSTKWNQRDSQWYS